MLYAAIALTVAACIAGYLSHKADERRLARMSWAEQDEYKSFVQTW